MTIEERKIIICKGIRSTMIKQWVNKDHKHRTYINYDELQNSLANCLVSDIKEVTRKAEIVNVEISMIFGCDIVLEDYTIRKWLDNKVNIFNKSHKNIHYTIIYK